MPHAVLSPAAQRDIASILLWSEEHFGEAARLRYEALLIQAIDDLALDPLRTGSEDRAEIAEGLRSDPLWHSRNRIAQSPRRGRRPPASFAVSAQREWRNRDRACPSRQHGLASSLARIVSAVSPEDEDAE